MIAWEAWALFLGYAVPMVISPGPGNTVLATAGARFGIGGSLPFWFGFELANLALCLAYGFGIGRTGHAHPEFHQALRWIGTAYLLYLAWGFFRASAKQAGAHDRDDAELGFSAGFLSVLLNPKIHSMILVMFAQFLDPARALAAQILQLTAAFLVVCVLCHFPWIYGGKLILGRFRSARAMRFQGVAFGVAMLVVAASAALG